MNGIDVDVLPEALLPLVGDVEAIGEDGILAGAAFSGKNGRIAFSAFTPKRGPSPDEIFTTNPDGTGERQRTRTTPRAFNSSPSYSPDGTKIAWERVVVGPNGPNLSRDDVRPSDKDTVVCGSGFDRVLANRKDVVAPDCEKVSVGDAEKFYESIPQSFFEGLHPDLSG